VDCDTYIREYLSAHVDGELNVEHTRAAEEHLAGCANCRARYAEERAVKALLRERSQMLRTPVQVRGSILAALDGIDNAERARDRGIERGASRPASTIRRARVWIPVAMAAVAVFAFVILHSGGTPAHAIPAFDVALDRYSHFVDHFEPNIKSTTPADISDAYLDHKMPGFLWNFRPSGYELVGGRVEHLPDGSPIAFTFYRHDGDTILCTYMKGHGLQPPPGAIHEMGGHTYYHYRGHNICLSFPHGGFICILVSGGPMKEFVENIVTSEPWSRY
jgi:hypothetical protein